MVRRQRGFSLIELMVVVAIIGVLAAIAIPTFSAYARKTKTTESMLQLNSIAKGAKTYHNAQGGFPQGTATPMPGTDGGACATITKKFAVDNGWAAEPTWTALGFQIGEPNLFTYHYTSADPKAATATAVGDLDCDSTLITYTLELGSRDGIPSAIITPPPANAD